MTARYVFQISVPVRIANYSLGLIVAVNDDALAEIFLSNCQSITDDNGPLIASRDARKLGILEIVYPVLLRFSRVSVE